MEKSAPPQHTKKIPVLNGTGIFVSDKGACRAAVATPDNAPTGPILKAGRTEEPLPNTPRPNCTGRTTHLPAEQGSRPPIGQAPEPRASQERLRLPPTGHKKRGGRPCPDIRLVASEVAR